MDSELEYATLNRPRVEARQSLGEFKRGRHHPRRTRAEQRLEQVEREIKQELFDLAMNRLSRAEAPRLPAGQGAGLGAILCDGAGELIGRDYTG